MKRIPFDRFSDKRFYYANAPPCKQGFSLTTDFTWRILLCTKKFLIRFDLLQINGISTNEVDYLNVEDPDVFSHRAWELKYQREQEIRRNQPARTKKKSYDIEL